jgi:hypothetical protein
VNGKRRTWLVECYATGIGAVAVAGDGARIRAAVEVVREEDGRVEYLGALLVAGDEAVFHAFAAEGETEVAAVARRAGLRYARIVESVAVAAPGLADALTRLLAVPSSPGPRAPR